MVNLTTLSINQPFKKYRMHATVRELKVPVILLHMMIEPILIEKFKSPGKKLVLLDYDGTLVEYAAMPDKAIPSPRVLRVLKNLSGKSQTKVFVITGRKYNDIDRLLGHLPIGVVAEHGAMCKENGQWVRKIDNDGSWKVKVLPLLNKITLTCPNSFIEEKHFSLTWHYRNVETNTGNIHSRELIRLLDNVAQSYNLKVIDGNKVVEVMSNETSKGIALQYLFEPNDYDCVLCIGDDRTDEDMFEYLQDYENAVTIKVGEGKTSAKYKLDAMQEVIQFLEKL